MRVHVWVLATTAPCTSMRRDREDFEPSTDPEGQRDSAHALTDEEAAIVELEREFWKYPGAKDATIRSRFSWTPTRYYQALNALIDRPEALAADPVTVNRLRRLRHKRREQRSSRRRPS